MVKNRYYAVKRGKSCLFYEFGLTFVDNTISSHKVFSKTGNIKY